VTATSRPTDSPSEWATLIAVTAMLSLPVDHGSGSSRLAEEGPSVVVETLGSRRDDVTSRKQKPCRARRSRTASRRSVAQN
jgi:hypothetical protein